MRALRAWKYRLYPTRMQEVQLEEHLGACRVLWNSLLEYVKTYYQQTGKFPSRKQLYAIAKPDFLFSQVAQNVADRLHKALMLMVKMKKAGRKAGFPRFKSEERMRSFCYPQFGFRLNGKKLELSKIGAINIKKHRELEGEIKTLTIKKARSGRWHAVFITEKELTPASRDGESTGIDLGIENFAYLSNGEVIPNPRHLKLGEERLKKAQQMLSRKKKGSGNRTKARLKLARAHEALANRRMDFLHKLSKKIAGAYSLIALENLDVKGMSGSFLAKHILDCGWTGFIHMLRYKAEEAGGAVVLVDPANTSQRCSSCSRVAKKSLAERWHSCACGASMHRDLNAAINILQRATGGTPGSHAPGEAISTHYKVNGQISSVKEEAHGFSRG